MARKNDGFCGEFYSDSSDNAQIIGYIYKTSAGFVIRIKAEWSGKTLHESAPFPGNAFRKFRTLNLGYTRVNCYTAA